MQDPLVVDTDENTHQVTAIISHFIRPGREQFLDLTITTTSKPGWNPACGRNGWSGCNP